MTTWTPPRASGRNVIRDGLVVAFVATDVWLLLVLGPQLAYWYDTASFWRMPMDHLYQQSTQALTGVAFRYSPIVAQVLSPFGALPWPAFVAYWAGINAAAALAIGGRKYWWLVLLFPFTILEIEAGNVHLLMALAVVVSFRWPVAWAFLALTKVTPGVGLLWYVFRSEWRSFAIGGVTTFAIVALGYWLSPDLWRQWVDSLLVSSHLPPLGFLGPVAIRLPIAVAVLFYAARTNRRWLVPVAVILAMPSIWPHSFAILAACIPLYRQVAQDAGLARADGHHEARPARDAGQAEARALVRP